jgi:catechol 2,3-dioxygenase-like lactoylglutathione lyase family enzyme
MKKGEGAFRFAYQTDKYLETCNFYEHKLEFKLEHSWDRNEHDKGALFKAGSGLIEVLLRPDDEAHRHEGLDYRRPQGAHMCIQVWNIDERFEKYQSIGIPFEQEIVDQPWGHRSFSILEPNGIVIMFFQEQF